MFLRTKIAISMMAIIAALVGITLGLATVVKQLRSSAGQQTPAMTEVVLDVPFSDATTFTSKPFTLDEGYTIDLVDGWELVGKTPDRSVDRYRFERKADAGASILTISVYAVDRTPDFDALVAARYGAALLRQQESVMVGTRTAKRLTAEFLDMGATADVLIQVDADTFMSIYGIRQPDVDADMRVAKEINFMQKSFR